MVFLATDIGPPCRHCQQTLWGYHVYHGQKSNHYDVSARCACCHSLDHTFVVMLKKGMAPSVQEVRAYHCEVRHA